MILLMLESFKWEYTFATDVLIAICDESPLLGGGASGAPDVSGHGHFGTYSIRCIVTSGHAQFGT